jgi:hypothetical protein
MDQATEYVRQNSGILSTVALIAVLIAILYVVYTYLYPADDPTYAQFLKGEADARRSVPTTGKVPAIYTGGDFTLSFWIYIDDFNYRAASSKFLFALSPEILGPTSSSPLVGALTPLRNGLMVRANTVANPASAGSAPGAMASGSAAPNINLESGLQALMTQKTSTAMFETTVDTPCDVKDVPLQRWVCITIVSSGRVLDIYMDGKLTRSCVLDSVVQVPRGNLRLRLGEYGGFGGRYSSVQMWSQQLTPDVIYGIYMMGPTQAQHNVITDVSKWLGINVSFTGSAPGQPIPGQAGAPPNPFASLYSTVSADVSSMYSSASADVTSMYSNAKSDLSSAGAYASGMAARL